MDEDIELGGCDVEVRTSVPEAVAALEADIGALVGSVVDRLRAQLPSYGEIPVERLASRVEQAVRDGLTVIQGLAARDGDPMRQAHDITSPRPDELESIGYHLPTEDVITAYRIGVDVVWSRFSREMTERRADPAETLAVAEKTWSWAGAMTLRILRRHNSLSGAATAEERRVEAYVRMLLLDPAALSVAGYGTKAPACLTDRLPFRARAASGEIAAEEVTELLRPWLATDGEGRLLVTRVEGDVSGLLVSRPTSASRRLVVGLGSTTGPLGLAAEFTRATQALDTAVSFGLTGVRTCEELGLRTAVMTTPALGEQLVRQRLAPLREYGAEGAGVEDAVRAYLEHGMRLEAAARSLFVHPNTLRNRLRRFQELSGTNLRDPGDLAEVWWALAHRRVHAPPPGTHGPGDGPSVD
ncbi:PucR family transcriptional regulator [Streptomyces sp. NPDC002004]